MGAPLEYDFRVIGRAVVEREIASLEKRFIASASRLNREFEKLAGGGSVSGSRGGSSGSSARFNLPGQKEYIAQQRLNHRQSLKEAREQERAAVQAVRAERQQVDNLNKSRQSIHNQRLREEKQARVESGKTDAQKQRAIDKQSSVQQSLARQRAREEALSKQAIQAKSDFIKSTVSGGVGRVANVIGSIGKTGLAVAGIGAAGITASSISQAMTLDDLSRRISVDSRSPGAKGVDPAMLSAGFKRSSIKSGISPEDIGRGVQTYVAKTGDVDTALKYQDTMATIAQGRSTDINDVFNMSATMNQAMGITSNEDMKKSYAILSEQGKRGRFELKDFGSEGPEILNAAGAAGMRGVNGIRDIGTLAQIGILGNNTKSETSTSIRSLFNAMYKHQDKVQSGAYTGGKKVQLYQDWDPKKKMLDVSEWLPNLIAATGGNMGGLEKSMDAKAFKTALPMANAYKEANIKAGGGKAGDKAGREAMAGIWGKFHNVSDDFGNVEADARDVMKSFSVQMEIINTKLKDAIASQLFPEIVKLIPQISALVPMVSKLVSGFLSLASWILDNPLKGLGAAVGISIAYELAKAGLASLFSTALTNMVSGAKSGGIGGAVGSVLPGSINGGGQSFGTSLGNALGPGLSIGAAVGGAILTTGIGKFEAGENSMTVGGASLNAVRSSKDIDAVKQAIAEQRKRTAAAHNMDMADNFLDTFGASNKAVEAKTQDSYLSEMENKLVELQNQAAKDQIDAAKALKDAATTLSGSKPNTGDKPSPIKTP